MARFEYTTAPETVIGDFVMRRFSALAYANGFTHWHYRADAIKHVRVLWFFADAIGVFHPGDQVTVSSPDGTLIGWLDAAGTLRPMELV